MFLQPNAARTETFEYGGFAAVEKRLRNEWVHRRMKAPFPECSRFVYSTPASGGDGWDTPKMRRGVDNGGFLVASQACLLGHSYLRGHWIGMGTGADDVRGTALLLRPWGA